MDDLAIFYQIMLQHAHMIKLQKSFDFTEKVSTLQHKTNISEYIFKVNKMDKWASVDMSSWADSKKEGFYLHIIFNTFTSFTGFTACTATNPIWFVKTRLQLDHSLYGQSTTALECIQKVYRQQVSVNVWKVKKIAARQCTFFHISRWFMLVLSLLR